MLATLWAIRRYRPETPLPWILFALGNLSFVIGDIIIDVRPDLSSPSVSDAFYLAGYPLVAAGLILLFVHAGGHHRRAAVAEAGIATFAFALFQWTFVMHPALTGSGTYGSRARRRDLSRPATSCCSRASPASSSRPPGASRRSGSSSARSRRSSSVTRSTG